jgi:hypothetical protein
MTWIEILGFVTGAASVTLAVRESAWNWLVGIANNVQHAKFGARSGDWYWALTRSAAPPWDSLLSLSARG